MSCQTTKEALRRLMVSLQRWDTPKLSLPRQGVQDFFEANDGQSIRDLARCKCGVFRGCASRHDPFDDAVIRRIRDPENPYIVVLGFLCYVDLTGLIHGSLRAGTPTNGCIKNELDREQLDELFGLPESGGKADSHIEYDIQLFFMPTIYGPVEQQHFSPMRTLPYTVEERIGGGGYGNVYRVKILDGGYFAFLDEAEERLVAIKHYTCTSAYNAKADWEKEWKNNLLYEHPHIVPILASVAQGEVYMNFYPLCEHDLHALLTGDPPDHDPESIWRQYMGLLSALRHVHSGRSDKYGYHFDIKCQNILVRKGKWMIADLGIAHNKSTDGTSLTGRRPGPEEFGAPETRVTRKFDIWGIACVGCIVLAWLLGGADGVAQFREDRKVEISEPHGVTSILYNFFQMGPGGAVVHPAVGELLSKANDPISKGVAAILKDMLSIDVNKRPTAEEAEKRFGEVLAIKPLALQLPRGANNRSTSGQLSVPVSEVSVPLRRQRSRASSIGNEAVVPVERPMENGHQQLGGELPAVNLKCSFSPRAGGRPMPSDGLNGAPLFVTAKLVVAPDDGGGDSDSEPPSEGANDQDAVPLVPGSWPCRAELVPNRDADGSRPMTTPPPLTRPQPPFAGPAGRLLEPLGSLSAVRNWVWRSAVATAGSAEHHGAPKTVAGEFGGGVSGM